MAPTQQRARKQGIAKPVTRKARPAPRQTSDSWEVLQRQRSGSRDSDIENEDPVEDDQPLAIEAAQTNDTILTLQEMADRLGREVEDFAESLDKFLEDLRPDDPYEDAFDLVLEFKKQAENRVLELSAKHEADKNEELRREWSEQAKLSSKNTKSVLASSLQARSITSARVKELRKYQEEADTWELFSIVLEQHYRPQAVAEKEKQAKLSKLSAVNRYSHDDDFFVRFLAEDSLGQERNSVKMWLEQTASHQQSSMDDIQQELVKQSKLGNGLWTRGWINTREKIKNEKRLRTWPAPDSSPLPQLRSLDTNELLVTSLDPDAASRQNRSIEAEDVFHERAIWITCWEMLRRGLNWMDVANWCETHQEGWRAVTLGKAMSTASVASAATWRRMCFMASQNECSNEYEAAVYGLLGGNIAAMQPVCKSVDDQLFARYSANLIRQFDQYLLATHPEQLPRSLATTEDSDLRNPDVAQSEILELIKKLRQRTETRAQSVSPLKLVQSYLLANETEALIHTMGVAIASESADTTIARPRAEQDAAVTKPEAEAALDPICLRVVAHISLVLQVLRKGELVVEEQEMEDNVLVSYVQLLHMSGKLDLLPLYASKLQQARGVSSMSAAIAGITDSGERLNMMNLMLRNRVDAGAVTQTIFEAALERLAKSQAVPFSIMKTTVDGVYPGKKVDIDNIPDTTSADQEALIRALEWFLLLPKQWSATMEAFTAALRTVLISGDFACARLICETFSSKDVMRLKSSQELGHSMDILSENSADEQPTWVAGMKARAKTYVELERLVEAFEALFSWTKQETVYLKHRAANTTLPSDIRGAFDVVEDAMEPLLSTNGFLLDSFNDNEAENFAKIRQVYVTEAIIAYITALYSAGTHVTRDKLLNALHVSTLIADQRTKLTETFSEAKRMGEVVSLFAQVSKRVLLMKECGGKDWKPKGERRDGRNHKIWDIPSDRTVASPS